VTTLRVPDRVGDLGSYLKEQREQARLSLRQLATAAGVSNPYLSQIERGLRRPSAEVLQQIARGLRISAEVLYVRAGILEESKGLEVEVAIRTDPTLTERQRRVLLDIYSTFQAENGRVAQSRTDGAMDGGTDGTIGGATHGTIESGPSRDGAPNVTTKPAGGKVATRTSTARGTAARRATGPASAAKGSRAGGRAAGVSGGPTAPSAR